MTPERWRQITAIFHDALPLGEAERSAFLASACAQDSSLRRQVESMIAAHHEGKEFGEAQTFVPQGASLEPGALVGPYRLEGVVGEGGMGQVYKARDTRLGRTVAVKVLAPELAHDPEFRSRFEREARAISHLEHPHICPLYDVGEQDGTAYLVMPHLQGETLAERLTRGALPIELALTTAAEIADALDAAHTVGITHRDLKPANIFLTKSGVKLLDFGLAKSTVSLGRGSDHATMAGSELTRPGIVLGTVPYMAPEQLEGKETDARTDLFALGVVIHEMATGRPAFAGEHQANLISAIMSSHPPPVSTLRPDAPVGLDRVVAACLSKDPEARWQSARDVRRALLWLLDPVTPQSSAPASKRWQRHLVPAGAALVLGALIASFAQSLFSDGEEATDPRAFRFEIFPPEGAAFAMSPAFMAVSPDGRSLAWHGPNAQGETGVWVRSLDSPEARMLPGTAGGVQPFWSPDSRSLAFAAGGKLKRIELSGGLAQTLADSPGGRSGTWSREGFIVTTPVAGALHKVPAMGGSPSPATILDTTRGETDHVWPHFLPDGKRFLYLARSTQPEHDGVVYVASLDSTDRVALFQSDSHVVYVPEGYLLFMQSDTLVAQPFDLTSLRTTGEPLPVAERLEINTETRRGAFSASHNGVVAFRPVGETQLTWFDRSGRQLGVVGPAGRYRNPALSPDEQRLAVARIDRETGAPDIWLIELARGVTSPFTSHPALDDMPIWSPDGTEIVFRTMREGRSQLYRKTASGGEPEQAVLATASRGRIPFDWSADGRFVIFGDDDAHTRFAFDLWRADVRDGGEAVPFLQTRFNETQAQLSPDGQWVAYVSNDSGRNEISVSRFPSGEGKWRLSTAGGVEPRWRGDGKEVFFVALDQSLMAVPVMTGPTVQAGVPVRLFQTGMRGTLMSSYVRNQYVSTADGQRFLIDHLPRGRAPSSSITVMVNWVATLRN
jgi:serine/threonine protein kinase